MGEIFPTRLREAGIAGEIHTDADPSVQTKLLI